MQKFSLINIKALIKDIPRLLKGETPEGQIFKDSLGSLLVNGGNKLIVLLTGIFMVRILGKSEYGVYSYLLSLIHILIIPVEFGLTNLIIRETAKGMTTKKYTSTKGIWLWSFRNSTILSIIILLLSTLGYTWGKNYFSQTEISAFFWALALLPFQSLVYVGGAALQGLKKVNLGQITELIIIPSLFIIFFLSFDLVNQGTMTAASTMALRALATLIGFIFTITYLSVKTPIEIRGAKAIYDNKTWLSSTLSLGMSSGFNVIKTRSSMLIMGLFVDSGQIGTFQVAVSTAALSGLALQAINAILAPHFASLVTNKDQKNLQRLVRASSLLVSAFNLIITIVFILFGKPLLSFAFGEELIGAYPSLVILLFGQLVNSFVGPVAYLLNMAGCEKDVMKTVGVSAVINIALTLIFTPIWGIIGGAIASLLTMIISQLSLHRLVHKKLGIISHIFGKNVQ